MRRLFRTLILRPLRRDLLRSLLTVIAVALGIAVVIAIELAGEAAAGSFESSLTTVVGKTDLEVMANGGIDEQWIGRLSSLQINARFSPAIETTISLETVGYVTLYGIDMIGEAGQTGDYPDCGFANPAVITRRLEKRIPRNFEINGFPFCVVKVVDSPQSDFIAADIAGVQQALGRYGKLDRIDIFTGSGESFDRVERTIRKALPPGYQVTRPGTRSAENQKMLGAFRWNLRILSYIALVVGAFLIYNTISISVVRRRGEIGILRALGTERRGILVMFLVEAAMFGGAGGVLGLLVGRVLAVAMVSLISQTVRSLYTSSSPSPIQLSAASAVLAVAAGIGVALVSAWGPALEAMRTAPAAAMGRGSREYHARLHLRRDVMIAVLLGLLAWLSSLPGPIAGRPVFGYISTLLSVGAAAFLAPGTVYLLNRILRSPLRKLFGAEGLLASRGLTASLRRTSVVVAALATAIAMMSSVGIMVGSFRETVLVWLDSQLRADLYIRTAGPDVAGEYPPLPPRLAEILHSVPGVDDIDVFTAMPLHYQGQRATLGAGDLDVQRRHARLSFQSGDRESILRSLPHPIARSSVNHSRKAQVTCRGPFLLALGARSVTFTVAGIYYEYSSEQGYVILDRTTLLRYLPDQPPTNIAVYCKTRSRPRIRCARISKPDFPIPALGCTQRGIAPRCGDHL